MEKAKRYVRVGHWGKTHKKFWAEFAVLAVSVAVALGIAVYFHEVAGITFALMASKTVEALGAAAASVVGEEM